MAPSARYRWLGYAVAGAATVAAMWWVEQGDQQPAPVVAAATPRAPAPSSAASRQEAARVRLEWLKRRPGEEVPRGDPFGSQGLGTQPPAQAAPPPAAVAPPPPPPQAPPLPFTYLGKWTEQGRTTVFLARGERHLAVRGTGKLDETYTVEAIDDRQLVLNYVPLGIRQTLPLVAGMPPAQAAGAAPAGAQEESSEESN
jgi:hypothetical protein